MLTERKHTSEIVENVLFQLRRRETELQNQIDQVYDDCGVDYSDRGTSGIIPWSKQEIIHILNSELDQLEKLLKGINKLNK